MERVDSHILNANKVICGNIDVFGDADRGLLSQNILAQLRNIVEHTALKAFSDGRDIEVTYKNLENGISFIKTEGKLNFLAKFHKLLQITTSHYTLDPESSERLMLKYYEYLLKIKIYLKSTHNLDILENIAAFPINTDPAMKEYYERIAEQIEQPVYQRSQISYNDRYYIQKIRPFFVKEKVYYEVTYTIASDKTSKFDRLIAFTKCDISFNYAVKLLVGNSSIRILGKKMPIQIIDEWEVSIRPCELDNFADIFGSHPRLGETKNKETIELMKFLTMTKLNMVEFIDSPDDYYQAIRQGIARNTKSSHFLNILDRCRALSQSKLPGRNVVRYLLYRLNNKIIKQQYNAENCDKLSHLYLEYGCIPFDQMPFNTSLRNHNPKLSDLFDCIDIANREHEIFARIIRNNTEIRGQLYTAKKDITRSESIDNQIETYNSSLYLPKHINRQIETYKNHVYIKDYENDTFNIITKLKELSVKGVDNYSNSADTWLRTSAYPIDCAEKEGALRTMFANSKVALVYGSAGTGKSTLIGHISNFFNDKQKFYLANTNPAVDNMKRRVNAANCTFKTITKFISRGNRDTECDLLFIDECSTVSNRDMLAVLKSATFKLLILVGDVFQIESILFGNWFGAAKAILPSSAVFELEKPYRSTNPNLLALWSKVRHIEDDILEHITRNNYSATLNESIFEQSETDEIILCLNYDGLYGINNINRFLQSSNSHAPIVWGVQTYKVGDPILFNETNRFSPVIYNNLKGRIVSIEAAEDDIQFDIEVIDVAINELDAEDQDFELVENSNNGNSIIRFKVDRLRSTDNDDDSVDTIVPFQVAYAVSIHKAQGLEYSSVKVVITNEIGELITHNIFYTAITRAKEKLKIYWTPETEDKVLKGLSLRSNRKDIALLRSKYKL